LPFKFIQEQLVTRGLNQPLSNPPPPKKKKKLHFLFQKCKKRLVPIVLFLFLYFTKWNFRVTGLIESKHQRSCWMQRQRQFSLAVKVLLEAKVKVVHAKKLKTTRTFQCSHPLKFFEPHLQGILPKI